MTVGRVIVVGAGLIGASSAYALARRGVPVEVIEARDAAGLETSFANGGILTPSMPDPWNGPGIGRHLFQSLFNPSSSMLLRPSAIPSLATWGLRFLLNAAPARFADATRANFLLADFSTRETRRWRDAEGLVFDSGEEPTLKFFRSRAAMEHPLFIARTLEPYGLRFQVLNPDQIVATEPALAPIGDRIAGGIVYPDDMRGDAHKFTGAIAARAAALGARFRYGVPVDRLIVENGRVAGVEAAGERIAGDSVLVCAANASRLLLAAHGIRLPVRPAKGYSLTFETKGMNDLPRHAVVDDGMHAAAIPLGDRLRVAGTAEFAGEDRTVDAARVDNLRRLLAEVYPTIAARLDDDAGSPWTGLRPMSADGRPFIGHTRVPGLWVNAGHGHLGWTMAAGSAALVTALMSGDAPPVDPMPYSATR